MKKYIILIIFSIFLLVPFKNVGALTEEELLNLDTYFASIYLDEDLYSYCFRYDMSPLSNYLNYRCFNNFSYLKIKSYNSSGNNYSIGVFSSGATISHMQVMYNITTSSWNNPFFGTMTSDSSFSIKLNSYVSNFDLFPSNSYSGSSILSTNWNILTLDSNNTYNITFNIPSGSTLIVKDSDNTILTPTSDNVYSLSLGTYTYSLYQDSHIPIENKLFSVNGNFTYNLSLIPLYNITFNIPSGSTLIVKDSDNTILTPTNDNIFNLESGTYTYTLSKNLYNSIETTSFVVSQDTTIDLSLEPILNLTSYTNVQTSYYSYLTSLIPILFDLQQPFFLIFMSIILVIGLIFFIKKLMKGGF